jgi:phage terminase large subunit GpA-like protein
MAFASVPGELLNSITDPTVTQVSVMKSARVGYSLCMSASIAYFMAQDPSSILVVQPTVDDAKNFSKETIAPMLARRARACALVLRDVEEKAAGSRIEGGIDAAYPQGLPRRRPVAVGANSGAGFRRVSRRVVMFDEVDAYPPSAGNDGDPINLGMKRSEAFHNRKIIAGSTPLIAGSSRIEELFLAGDQRRYHVPCPHCGHMDFFAFDRTGVAVTSCAGPTTSREKAFFECRGANCVIEHKDKRWMVERGKWIPDNPSAPASHRSYHLWSALSIRRTRRGGRSRASSSRRSAAAREAQDVREHDARRDVEGEGRGARMGAAVPAPRDVQDRQRSRWRVALTGLAWTSRRTASCTRSSAGRRTKRAGRSNAARSTATRRSRGSHLEKPSPWRLLDELARDFDGFERSRWLAVDSGYNTQMVYSWARRYPRSRVMACKGSSGARSARRLAVDVEVNTPVESFGAAASCGRSASTSRRPSSTAGCGSQHTTASRRRVLPLPQYDDEFFKQLTAEHSGHVVNRKTHRQKAEWHGPGNRSEPLSLTRGSTRERRRRSRASID